MLWAISQGGWQASRLSAVNAKNPKNRFLPLANPLHKGTDLPGLLRSQEAVAKRRTSRAELACLASWKRLLLLAEATATKSGWLLLMEDDVGASLASPQAWAHSLLDLISSCPSQTLAIQLAPINANVRRQLAERWKGSQGRCLSVAKEDIRSHGNGAVLIHQKALPLLLDPLLKLCTKHASQWHPLTHPWSIRPVADKWLYGALPARTCRVATYPHFCLEGEDSSLHQQHVNDYHRPSREITLEIWRNDHRQELLAAQETWDMISASWKAV